MDSELTLRPEAPAEPHESGSLESGAPVAAALDPRLLGLESKLAELAPVLAGLQRSYLALRLLAIPLGLLALGIATVYALQGVGPNLAVTLFFGIASLMLLACACAGKVTEEQLRRRDELGLGDNLLAQMQGVRLAERWLANQLDEELTETSTGLAGWLERRKRKRLGSLPLLPRLLVRLPKLLIPAPQQQEKALGISTVWRLLPNIFWFYWMFQSIGKWITQPFTLTVVIALVPAFMLMIWLSSIRERLSNGLCLQRYLKLEWGEGYNDPIPASRLFLTQQDGTVIASTLQYEVNFLEQTFVKLLAGAYAIIQMVLGLPFLLLLVPLGIALYSVSGAYAAGAAVLVGLVLAGIVLQAAQRAMRRRVLELKPKMLTWMEETQLLERCEAEYSATRREKERSSKTGMLRTVEQEVAKLAQDSGTASPDSRDSMLLMLQYGYNRLPVLLADQLPRLNQALVVIVSLALCVLPFVALAFTGIGYAAWPLALAVPALLWSVWAMPQQRRRDEKLWAAQLAYIDYLRDNFSR